MFPFFQKSQKKQPLTKVSLRYANTPEAVHTELCHLAWQMTIGNAKHSDVIKVLQEGGTFSIPADDYARLDVRDFRVYGDDHYFPDDREHTPAIVIDEGELLGCILESKRVVTDLADRNDACEFIERLEQVYGMYNKVKSGKKLPANDPKKKSSLKEEEDEPETEVEQETDEAADQEQSDMGSRPLYDHWGQLRNDEIAEELRGMTYVERERLFNALREEYDAVIRGMQGYADEYLNGMVFFANAVRDFNSEGSSAAKFLKENLNYQQAEEQSQAEEPQKQAPKSDRQKDNSGQDAKLRNYITAQKKNVRKWRKNTSDKVVIALLNDMMEALVDARIDDYKALRAEYEELKSADQQTNHDHDSSTGSNGNSDGSQSDGEPESESEPDPEGSSEDEDEASSGGSQDDSNSGEPGRKYQIKDVISWMHMVGVKDADIPSVLIMTANQSEGISAAWVNEYMASINHNARLLE